MVSIETEKETTSLNINKILIFEVIVMKLSSEM